MSFCTITPTRKDRPEFLEFCKHQLSRMTVKPDHSYIIDYPPFGKEIDLVPRVKAGIDLAVKAGFDQVFIIEDDDYYPSNYFEVMATHLNSNDFVGSRKTIYYNLRNKTYQDLHHSWSSLFCTGFKISGLKKFKWPPSTAKGLDIALWNHSHHGNRAFIDTGAIGIKHGKGLCAGAGHYKTLKHSDPDSLWLKDHVDAEAYIFYKTIKP